MSPVQNYLDVEDLALAWIKTTSVNDLTNKIFLGMPDGVPLPSVILSRVGGSPTGIGDVPVDIARISFSIWGQNRPQAKTIAKALVSECESLSMSGGYSNDSGYLSSAEVISWLWIPDEKVARYIVDVLFVSVSK